MLTLSGNRESTLMQRCYEIQGGWFRLAARRKGNVMKTYLVAYINRNGNKTVKSVTGRNELEKVVKKLDERIRKGTCGGYTVTLF